MNSDTSRHQKTQESDAPLESGPVWSTYATPQFTTTRWSIVLAASDPQQPSSRPALEYLCRSYWPPVYAFIRRTGVQPEDASDLAQSFFAALLEDQAFARADANKGRFRSFLLGALKHFLAHERDRRRALKRGGHVKLIPLDAALAESRYGPDLASKVAPEAQFDRAWAITVLDRVLARLREEFERSGRGPLWERMKGFLLGDRAGGTYAQTAADLSITEAAAKMTVTRMRQRFHALVRQEIAETVTDAEQLEEELQAFVEALVT